MESLLGSALIGAGQAGGGIGSTLIQGRQNRRIQRNAQQHEISMWHKANDWNLPKNQVQRMLDAGLNPHLAKEGISGSPAGVANTVEERGVDKNGLLDPAFQVAMQWASTKSQLETAELEREATRADIANKDLPRLKFEMNLAMQEHTKELQRLTESRSSDLHSGNLEAQIEHNRKVRKQIDGIAQQMLLAMRADGRTQREHLQQLRAMMNQNNVSEAIQNYVISKSRSQAELLGLDVYGAWRDKDFNQTRRRFETDILRNAAERGSERRGDPGLLDLGLQVMPPQWRRLFNPIR